MAGRTRSRSVTYGQLMLFAALLFGIVTMHTVGHPAEHSGSAGMPAASASTSESPDTMGEHPAPHDSPGADAPMSGMDPLSVCLAVLGVWGLALVGSWLLGPRADGRPLGTPAGAGLPHALRPNPPPPISVLASVSVLRM
ncbi:hypothetical protein TK78_25760 [Streptomyces sp. Tue 6075]|uniref:hypothetical protein n=1 Tax=Streptomyces sp. Tue 6075 TaxID=1661694 RepID=UPI00094A6601|nr:hypothetical protein [Streptomyces sp. Tue 6075]APS21948.1 hypothetical protein TK78_25760 [Streptomyces sp. Tue 6075]